MKIKHLEPKSNYHLIVEFSNGKQVDVNCEKFMSSGLGKDLYDYKLFSQAKVDDFGGVYWPNGFDICPDLIEYPNIQSV